jgi:hypothetical protein
MKDKLLIWNQEYDVVNFTCIINRDDLNAYIMSWVAGFLDQANNRENRYPELVTFPVYKYLEYKIQPHGSVNVKFEHDGYTAGERIYPPDEYWGGFNFLDLNEQITWDEKMTWKP